MKPGEDTVEEGTSASTAVVNHYSVKVPPFYQKFPETWFLQLESQFVLGKITSERTKFHHALSALPEDVACNVNITDSMEYTALKEQILSNLKANKHVLIQQALNTIELGDRRPSQLVAEITRRFSEIGLKPDDSIVKSRLLSALPNHIKSALVGHDGASLEDYAKIADSMLAVAQPVSNSFYVGAINNENRPSSSNVANKENYRSKSHSVRPFYAGQRPRLCNAHIFYASNARHCRSWCKWPHKPERILKSDEKTPRNSRASSPTNI